MRKYNIEAIVLKNINYKDSHRIYTLLTREKGKITAVARGVRKISSKRSGSLDTLNNISLNITEDKAGFYSINEVKVINSFVGLKNSLDLILAGMYLAELVDLFLHLEHENTEVYRLLKSGLTVLSKKPPKAELAINVFEFRLLDRLGFGLTVGSCTGCGRVFDSTWDHAKMSVDNGGLVCSDCTGGNRIYMETASLFNEIKSNRSIDSIFERSDRSVVQVDKIIKDHLKLMVETNARFPRINSFLANRH